jgi:hypothetical protein
LIPLSSTEAALKREGQLSAHRPLPDEQEDETTEDRRTASLAGIVVILLLLIGGLFLVHRIHSSTAIQDCVMAGRNNCDTITPTRR